MTAGYSGTPLAKKLGIKPGHKLYLHNAPENYRALVEPLPEGVAETAKFKDADVLHIFTNRRAELEMLLENFFRPSNLLRLSGSLGIKKPPGSRRRSRKTPSAIFVCRWVLSISKFARLTTSGRD